MQNQELKPHDYNINTATAQIIMIVNTVYHKMPNNDFDFS